MLEKFWIHPAKNGKHFVGFIFKNTAVVIVLGVLLASSSLASKPGDVNGDNSVDTADLATIIQLLSSGKPPIGAALRADVNRDGVIDTQDIAALVGIMSGDRGLGECEEGMWDCCYYLPPWGCCGSEICNEDDDGGAGGGGSEGLGEAGGGEIGGGGGPVVPCDGCDDFQAQGPNYAGPGDPVYGGGVFCGRYVTTDTVIVFGAHLLVNGVAGDTPGTVRFRSTVEFRDGTTCTDTHDVQIVRYEPVRLRYATFIECPLVANPASWVPTVDSDYFGGDDRGPSATAISYRTCHEIEVVPHQFAVAGPEVFPYNLTPFGVTNTSAAPIGMSTGYDDSDVTNTIPPAACPTTLLPGATPVTMATLALSAPPMPAFGGTVASFGAYLGNHVSYVRRTDTRTMKVYLWLNAANPLFIGSPAINGFVQWTLHFSTNGSTGQRQATVQYSGIHDGFPAHEMYVNDVWIYDYSPLQAGHGPIHLGPPFNMGEDMFGALQIPN